jgi:HEPN domain-containing protein
MRPEALAEAHDWLMRSRRDIDAGQRVLVGDDPLPDIAVYHAQQAAEKALKAFPAANDEPFPKTHDLEPLLLACQTIDPSYQQFTSAVRTLTPYATQFRYPGGPLEPEDDDAVEAIRLATQVVDHVDLQLQV